MNALRCDGACDEHEGEVVRVSVSGGDLINALTFNYCAAAITEDRRRGFDVMLASIQPAYLTAALRKPGEGA